jgi:hypothetical protein
MEPFCACDFFRRQPRYDDERALVRMREVRSEGVEVEVVNNGVRYYERVNNEQSESSSSNK